MKTKRVSYITFVAVLVIPTFLLAANPVGGNFDYPLDQETVNHSYGFPVTGSTWEVLEEYNDYTKLKFKLKLFDANNTELFNQQYESNEWGGFYEYIPPWGYTGPDVRIELTVIDKDDNPIWCDVVFLNAQ